MDLKIDSLYGITFWETHTLYGTNIPEKGYYCNPPIVTLNIMYDLHNVINVSIDVRHVLVLSYY